jgi:hypothetical protein
MQKVEKSKKIQIFIQFLALSVVFAAESKQKTLLTVGLLIGIFD